MSGKATMRDLAAANRPKLFLQAIAAALFALHVLSCPTSKTYATIIGTGDVYPANPATWTSSTTGYIGQSSTGTVTVNGGSGLLSNDCYLGYNSGSVGTATVTGSSSKWTNSDDLEIGKNGSGTLIVEAGGQVSNLSGYLGYMPGSAGRQRLLTLAQRGPIAAVSMSASLAAAR